MIMEFFKRDPEKIQIESDDPVNGDVLIRTWNWHFSPQNDGDKRWPSGYFYLNPKKICHHQVLQQDPVHHPVQKCFLLKS